MPRTHIHKYETRYDAKAIYSKAIRVSGDLVVMQGQVGTLLDGTVVGEGDPGQQADQACPRFMRRLTGGSKGSTIAQPGSSSAHSQTHHFWWKSTLWQ